VTKTPEKNQEETNISYKQQKLDKINIISEQRSTLVLDLEQNDGN